ncbi:MAG TPA: hypothetical protein PK339_12590 [Flavitalea sp.]|nr:hypothetical protein [Flavitalea sp.]
MKIFNKKTIKVARTSWTAEMYSILRRNYLRKGNKELSDILSVSPTAISIQLSKLGLKRPGRIRKEKAKKRIETTDKIKAESKLRQKEKILSTRQQDLSKMRTLRIDHKTFVYLRPGQDPEKVKKQYHRTLSKNGYSKIEY